MPKVSVIVPNYNHSAYLKQRIDSVLSQTFDDFEIIILDDNSTDCSLELIETYRKHPKVTHIILDQQNSGSTFKQWDKGIQLAKGNWIWIAESDDWCEPSLLEALSPAFDDAKNCALAFCQATVVRNNGDIVMSTSNRSMEEVLTGGEFMKERMLYMNSIFNASMAVFRKDLYYQVSKRFTNYKFCGDWLFWIEVAMRGNVFISGKVLNYFRKHDGDVSTKAFTSGLYYDEYLKLTGDLCELNFISNAERKKLIRANFKKYYFQKPNIKEMREKLTRNYRGNLGFSYYMLSGNLLYKKFANRVYLVSLAIRRRLH